MGVWIETKVHRNNRCQWGSHPVWVCGLKRSAIKIMLYETLSHPVWVCGLKPDGAA